MTVRYTNIAPVPAKEAERVLAWFFAVFPPTPNVVTSPIDDSGENPVNRCANPTNGENR